MKPLALATYSADVLAISSKVLFDMRLPKGTSWYGAAFYALMITIVAVIASVALLFLISSGEVDPWDIDRAIIISAVIAPPMGLFSGFQLMRISRLTKRLRTIVDRDRLTDVATRDFFFNALARDPNAYGVSLMIDIDHFKSVNDTYGHLTGDDVIQTVARVLKQQVRAGDIVCRFGGEEFVVFLEHADETAGWQIAERIRLGAEAAVTDSAVGPVKITVSIGGSLKNEIELIDEAIRRADACLYEAKEGGRNRTVVDWRDAPTLAAE